VYSGTTLIRTDTFGPLKCVLTRKVSSFQGVNNTYSYEVGIWSSVLIREMSSFQGVNNTYSYEVGIWSSVLIREMYSFQGMNNTIHIHMKLGLGQAS